MLKERRLWQAGFMEASAASWASTRADCSRSAGTLSCWQRKSPMWEATRPGSWTRWRRALRKMERMSPRTVGSEILERQAARVGAAEPMGAVILGSVAQAAKKRATERMVGGSFWDLKTSRKDWKWAGSCRRARTK